MTHTIRLFRFLFVLLSALGSYARAAETELRDWAVSTLAAPPRPTEACNGCTGIFLGASVSRVIERASGGDFVVGISVLSQSQQQTVGAVTTSVRLTIPSVDVMLKRIIDSPFYMGVRIGPAVSTATVSTAELSGSGSETLTAAGGILGLEFVTALKGLSIGIEISALSIADTSIRTATETPISFIPRPAFIRYSF